MAYTLQNFKTRKELIAAIKAGQSVKVVGAGNFPAVRDGIEWVEGPHFPAAHSWSAEVTVQGGYIVAVKGAK